MKQLEALTLSRGATNVVEFDFSEFDFYNNSYCQFAIKRKNGDKVICKIDFNNSKKYYVIFKDEFTSCLHEQKYEYDIMYMINDERYPQCLISEIEVNGVVNNYDGEIDLKAIEVKEALVDEAIFTQTIKVKNVNNIIVNSLNQEKVVQPTTDEQVILPDENYDGLSKVTIKSIPSEYIIPHGILNITDNGEYDVNNYAKINVNVDKGYFISINDETLTFQKNVIVDNNEVIL